MGRRDLLPAIDALYGAALEPEQWQTALAAVSDAVGAVGTVMVPIGPGAIMRSIASDTLAEANQAYQETWWSHDVASARLLSRGIRPGAVGTERAVMDEDEIRRDPFHQEFRRSFGLGQCLAAVASLGSGRLLSIAAQRSLADGPFQAEDMTVMAALSPHLGRAIAITTALVEARQASGELGEAIERLDRGVILLDGAGDVRHVNAVAAQMLGDGLSISGRRVRAALREDDDALQAAIKAALPDSVLPPGAGVVVRRRDMRSLLFVEAAPVRPRSDAFEVLTFGAGGAMLLVRSLDTARRSLAQHLRALGLTPAEARLAEALGQGLALRAAAERQAVTYETARTYLRSIFTKLGIGRQAELVALVVRLSSTISG